MNTSSTRSSVRSEWIKLVSTRSLLRHALAAVVLSVLITGLMALAVAQYNGTCSQPGKNCKMGAMSVPESVSTIGVLGDGTPGAGLIALMLLGASIVLVDLRYGTIGTTSFAEPHRWRVIAAKAGLAFGISFLIALVAVTLSAVTFKLIAPNGAEDLQPWGLSSMDIYLRTAVVVALAAAAAVGIAASVRAMAAAIAVVLLWPLVVEQLLTSLLPAGGDTVAALLPFANARRFIGLESDVSFFWSPAVGGLYFAAVVMVLVALGMWITHRSDVRTPS